MRWKADPANAKDAFEISIPSRAGKAQIREFECLQVNGRTRGVSVLATAMV
jgi:hypothetical protein